ncbi:hypothetical protein PSHT_09069 [Puccinia striiformis]|uniref:Uncharacterized protein n=2 Tax=Puccinia striiformis TaxID=27350 RepID=A0A2S4VAF3_9BASI|nr:hypothetical protein PSTT_08919 [Puccinia striiformis]POW09587.1 hypothetical protein PSHT_09069 [Puccinia striiformis]
MHNLKMFKPSRGCLALFKKRFLAQKPRYLTRSQSKLKGVQSRRVPIWVWHSLSL